LYDDLLSFGYILVIFLERKFSSPALMREVWSHAKLEGGEEAL
jgi:hypothetical protein